LCRRRTWAPRICAITVSGSTEQVAATALK